MESCFPRSWEAQRPVNFHFRWPLKQQPLFPQELPVLRAQEA